MIGRAPSRIALSHSQRLRGSPESTPPGPTPDRGVRGVPATRSPPIRRPASCSLPSGVEPAVPIRRPSLAPAAGKNTALPATIGVDVRNPSLDLTVPFAVFGTCVQDRHRPCVQAFFDALGVELAVLGAYAVGITSRATKPS
jgi:hypothetical protein